MSTIDVVVLGALFLAILALLAFFPVARVVVRESFARPTTTSRLVVEKDGSVHVKNDESGSLR